MSEEEEPFELTTQSIDDWELMTDQMREMRITRDKLKQNIIKALADEDGIRLSGWIGPTRVRIVDTKSTTFSVSELRDKYGDEWVEENSHRTSGSAIEIKTMVRHRPADVFEIPPVVE